MALHKHLKNRILGLAAIEKSRARQKSRITWMRKEDANTKYFQIMANIRKQKNHIHALQIGNSVAITQIQKHATIYNHFLDHIGTHIPRTCHLNFNDIGWKPRDLQYLDQPFSKQEVK
jgi:hypothetical protein